MNINKAPKVYDRIFGKYLAKYLMPYLKLIISLTDIFKKVDL